MPESLSEKHGLEALRDDDLHVLSVGISTGGEAEITMAKANSERRIVATTLDIEGAALVAQKIEQIGLSHQVMVRIEDVAQEVPLHQGEPYDYAYARLVLHYLSARQLNRALQNLHDSLRDNGRLFVVVRSAESDEAKQSTNTYDSETCLTTYVTAGGQTATRYFHTQDSITSALVANGFTIDSISQYDEKLSPSFNRDNGVWVPNNLIEVTASKPGRTA